MRRVRPFGGVRGGVVLLALLLGAPLVSADHPLVVILADWTEPSTWLVGAPVGVPGLNEARFALDVPECHRLIRLDLLFSPYETVLAAEGVGSVGVGHEVRTSLSNGTTQVATSRVTSDDGETYDHTAGLVPTAGAYEMLVWLSLGAHVEWSARVKGIHLQSEPGCGHPLE